MNAYNMTCEAVEATLPDFLDEILEPWLRTAVQDHLGECVRCAGLVRDLRGLQRDAAALADLAPERDLWDDIARGIGTPVVPFASVAASQSAPTVPTMSPAPPAPPAPVAASQPVRVAASRATPAPPAPPAPAAPAGPAAPAAPGQPPFAPPTPVTPIAARHTRIPYDARPYDRRFGPLVMGLAAAALLVVTASTTYLLTVRALTPVATQNVATAPANPKPVVAAPSSRAAGTSQTPPEPAPLRPPESPDVRLAGTPPSPPASSRTATMSLVNQPRPNLADQVYENEVAKLQTIMSWRKGQLNPSTAAIIERNLRIIDEAIAQSKKALRTDPSSAVLSGQLTHALDMKVGLLRRAAMLAPST